MMRAATCFSGIGAPECAAPWATWLWAAEIDTFASAVHDARFPGVPNLGDVLAPDFLDRARAFGELDLIVGGPPCQAFSVAGLRRSLDDARGNLTLRWVQIIHAIRPVWAVTENVPGWLSTKDNAFGCFLAGLVGADAPLVPGRRQRWTDAGVVVGPERDAAWRILDAQHFGVAQRRRRVFVVSRRAGDGIGADALLPLTARMSGYPAPSRKTREAAARPLAACAPGGSGYRNDADTAESLVPVAFGGNRTGGPVDVATAVNAHGGPHGRLDFETETFVIAGALNGNGKAADSATQQDAESGMLVTHSLRADGFDASEDGTGRGTPLVVGFLHHMGAKANGIGYAEDQAPMIGAGKQPAVAFDCKASANTGFAIGDVPGALRGEGHGGGHAAIAFDTTQTTSATNRCNPQPGDPCHPLAASAHAPALASAMAVRRLTPTECERLQAFPDGWTDIPWRRKPHTPDGPRYRALGNSMCVNVIGWVLDRIRTCDAVRSGSEAA